MTRHIRVPEITRGRGTGYVVCPNCGRLTATDTGYCRHCKAPLFQLSGSLDGVPDGYRWDIPVGESGGGTVGFSCSDLVKHTLIVGLTGSGKTTLAMKLLCEAWRRGISFTVVDWDGDYRRLASCTSARVYRVDRFSDFRVNIFDPGGVDPSLYSIRVSGILEAYLLDSGVSLTPQMTALIKRAVRRTVVSHGGFKEFFDYVEMESRRFPQGHMTAAAVKTRLMDLVTGASRHVYSGRDSLGGLGRESMIIDLSYMSRISIGETRFLVHVILSKLRFKIAWNGKTNRLNHLLVVDEGEFVVPDTIGRPRNYVTSFTETLIHYRKWGLGTIIISHSPGLIDSAVLKSVGNIASFKLNDPIDANLIAGHLGLRGIEELQNLKRGEFIVKPYSSPQSFRVQVSMPDCDDSDAERIYRSIIEHPFLSQRERRSYLRMDSATYRRGVEKLVREGRIIPVTVYTGYGRPVKLFETRGSNPSIRHEYGVHKVLETLGSIGLQARKGRRADVEVVLDDETVVGVEVETGLNIDRGKYMRFLSEYHGLVVVCIDRKCMDKARRKLQGLGGCHGVTNLHWLTRTMGKTISCISERTRSMTEGLVSCESTGEAASCS